MCVREREGIFVLKFIRKVHQIQLFTCALGVSTCDHLTFIKVYAFVANHVFFLCIMDNANDRSRHRQEED